MEIINVYWSDCRTESVTYALARALDPDNRPDMCEKARSSWRHPDLSAMRADIIRKDLRDRLSLDDIICRFITACDSMYYGEIEHRLIVHPAHGTIGVTIAFAAQDPFSHM